MWLGSAAVPAAQWPARGRRYKCSRKHYGSSEQRWAVGDGEIMKKTGKNITKARQAVEARPYQLKDAVPLLQKVKFAKFDETVEITMRLGVDPKHADQMVRGTVVLPHGLGKSKRVLVIASGEKVKEAEQAGADYVGGEEMVEKINKENWTDFDALIATPDVMKSVGKGKYVKGCYLSSSMGPGISIDTTAIETAAKA